jgi:hypothetical protein
VLPEVQGARVLVGFVVVAVLVAIPAFGSPSQVNTATIGEKTFKVDAENVNGTKKSKSVTYDVDYRYRDFFLAPPFRLPWPGGKTLPFVFRLFGNQGLNVIAAGYPQSARVTCGSADLLEQGEPTSGSLVYSGSLDLYTYKWTTSRAWIGTCRQFILKLNDGTFHRANLRFFEPDDD